MIKFFRHIRKSLIEKNQMRKYFKYAIGEILLVVIGIVIALQFNNWNQARLTKIKTNNYLEALVKEIDKNTSSLENYIQRVHYDIEECANSLRLLNLPEAVSQPDSIIRKAMDTRPIYKFVLSKSTFNDLINAGILEYVTDAKLKDRILSIESHVEGCYEVSKKAVDTWDVFHMPYLMKNKNVTDNWDSINGVALYKTPFKLKREAFVHSYEYSNILGLRMNSMGNYEKQLKSTKLIFTELSNDIRYYLDN